MPHLDDYLVALVWQRAAWLDPNEPEDLRLLRAIAERYRERTADPARDGNLRAAHGLLAEAESALEQLDDDRAAGAFPGASGTERYLRQVAILTERIDTARAAAEALAVTNDDDLGALLDMLAAIRDEMGSTDYRSPESPWAIWTVEERRAFLAMFLGDVRVAKASGHAGGDRAKWRGAERVSVQWVDVIPF